MNFVRDVAVDWAQRGCGRIDLNHRSSHRFRLTTASIVRHPRWSSPLLAPSMELAVTMLAGFDFTMASIIADTALATGSQDCNALRSAILATTLRSSKACVLRRDST